LMFSSFSRSRIAQRNAFPITCWRAADNQINGKWRRRERPLGWVMCQTLLLRLLLLLPLSLSCS
jgi:hypothetical protein